MVRAELRGVEREKHLGQMWQALSGAELGL